MSGDACDRLREALNDPRGILGNSDVRRVVDSYSGIEECIVDGLVRALEAGDWLDFERYVFAASRHLDGRYVDVLSAALSRRIDSMNNDDIVVLLGDIASQESVDSLIDALWWCPEWDEFHQLARKCIWALGRVGTDEALTALRNVVAVGPIDLREEAEHELAARS